MHKKVTNFNLISELTDGNPALIKKYIAIFLYNTPNLIQDLRQNSSEINYPAIKHIAHTLKPQVGYMGMEEQKKILEEIEKLCVERESINKIIALINSFSAAAEIAYSELNEFLLTMDAPR